MYRVLILFLILAGVLVQSVVGEWGLTFLLLLLFLKRRALTYTLVGAFLLGMLADLVSGSTIGMASIAYMSFVLIAHVVAARFERHPILVASAAGLLALGTSTGHRSIELARIAPLPLFQSAFIVLLVGSIGLVLELRYRQPGITLRV